MNHKLTRRLIAYFSAALLLFAVVVGSLFMLFSTRHTAALHQSDLKARAVSIAENLSAFSQETSRQAGSPDNTDGMNACAGGMGCKGGMSAMGGYGAYLQMIDQIAMSEVWLVDEQAQTIQVGHRGGQSLSYNDLPAGAEGLIRKVFSGNVEMSSDFNPLLSAPAVTVGAPIYDANRVVVAALLLHSPIAGMQQAQRDGLLIFVFCISAALLLAALLSVLLARRFISPLYRMAAVTEQLSRGDFSARTGVAQKDEIGALASDIDQLACRLFEAAQEQGKLEQLRRDFVSNISHELRTPVTVLKGSLEVLDEGLVSDPAQQKEYFGQMRADANHLQRLVNDLLELSRLQNTDFQIEKSELNLTDVLEEAVRSMRRIAAQKQVRIQVENAVGPFPFLGDYGRLRQMFTILLDNAVKFSPDSGVVAIRLQKEETGCLITVHDNGPGIPPEDLPHIFERFYRERSEQNQTGSGLGLSIARQIAQRHQADLFCESSPGVGSSFCLRFFANSGVTIGDDRQ